MDAGASIVVSKETYYSVKRDLVQCKDVDAGASIVDPEYGSPRTSPRTKKDADAGASTGDAGASIVDPEYGSPRTSPGTSRGSLEVGGVGKGGGDIGASTGDAGGSIVDPVSPRTSPRTGASSLPPPQSLDVLNMDGEGDADGEEEQQEQQEQDLFKSNAVSEVEDDEGGGGDKKDLLESEKEVLTSKRDLPAGGTLGGEGMCQKRPIFLSTETYLSSLTAGEDAAGDHTIESGGGGGRGGGRQAYGVAEVAHGKCGEGPVLGEVEGEREVECGRETGGGLFARLKIAKERREREREEREERERARERVEGGLPDEVERLLVSTQL